LWPIGKAVLSQLALAAAADASQWTDAAPFEAHRYMAPWPGLTNGQTLIPGELSRGFGFYQSKPATSFAPIAVTPRALGADWRHGMLHLPVHTAINGQWLGSPNPGVETVFHFGQVIAHLARTRALCAGTMIGAGTISNQDPAAGNACITEARVRQMLQGTPEDQLHPYLQDGDRVRIEVRDASVRSVFGAIDQAVRIAELGV